MRTFAPEYCYAPKYKVKVTHGSKLNSVSSMETSVINECISDLRSVYNVVALCRVNSSKVTLFGIVNCIQFSPCHISTLPPQLALMSEDVIDPRQHECLAKLPQIFYKAMRGVSIMVNAFLGMYTNYKEIE